VEYSQLPGIWLEIPSRDLQLPVVGVPLGDGSWDVTWLGRQAGYLEGSTYPTQLGTTLITAHVYLADGRPGPFVDIGELDWGDEVILHVDGAEHVYQVTSKLVVWPDDLSLMIEDGYYRMTLITCKGYDVSRGEYAYRTAVQTVLVEIR
jgi:LPXTG-site transpeptidase (sortase) family protein